MTDRGDLPYLPRVEERFAPRRQAGYGRGSGAFDMGLRTTINKVASGPAKTEIKNQAPPLRPLL